MAITILKQPKSIVWSKNPVVFEFSTDNRYQQNGSVYIGELDFVEVVSEENSSFTLSWKGISYEFVFKDEPNDSGQELKIFSDGQTFEEWKREISDELNSFFPLYEDFVITYEENKIKLMSRVAKQSMNLEILSSSGVQMSLYNVQNASDQILRENFAFFIEIFLQNSTGNYESFTRSVIEVDGENKAIWDIQEYLTAGLLQQGEPKPDFETISIYKEKNSARNFYLRYAEMFGYPQEMKVLKTTAQFTAVLGGVDLEHIDTYSLPDYLKDGPINKWIRDITSKRNLLDQKDYACIINLGNEIQDATLNIEIYYPDKKLVKETIDLGTWNTNEKIHIPVGVMELNTLLNLDIGIPSSISLTIRKESVLITNSLEFAFMDRYNPYSNILMFLNSLGCYESIFTSGRSEFSYAIDKNDRALEQKISRNYSEGSIKEIDIQLRNELKINSGYRCKEEISKFRDFILSKSKFVLHNGTFKPVILDTNSINEFQDGNHLTAISFSLKFSNEQTLFSK